MDVDQDDTQEVQDDLDEESWPSETKVEEETIDENDEKQHEEANQDEDSHGFATGAKVFERNLKGHKQFRVLIFQRSECLWIHGVANVRVVFGELQCFGSVIRNRYQTIVSPYRHGVHSLRAGDDLPSSTIDDWYQDNVAGKSSYWTEEDNALGMDEFIRSIISSASQEVKNTIVAVAIFKVLPHLSKLQHLKGTILADIGKNTVTDPILQWDTCRLLTKSAASTGRRIMIPPVWELLVKDWTRENYPAVVLQCGKKHVGKSTLMRYLVNALCSKVGKVAVLDCDLGQPELTSPGLVSLSVVDSPLLGPSFANIHATNIIFQEAQNIGTHNAKEKLQLIFSAALHLFARFKYSQDPVFQLLNQTTSDKIGNDPFGGAERRHIPIVINTHGWIDGPGYTMLQDMVFSAFKPTKLIQIIPKGEGSIFNIDACTAQGTELISLEPAIVHVNYDSMQAMEKRNLQIASVIGADSSRPVYCLPWAALRIHVLDAEVPFSQIMYILNASIVSLVVDYTDYISTEEAVPSPDDPPRLSFAQSTKPTVDTTLPRFLLEPPPMISSRCVGIGLIMSIDMERRTFYIATLVPPSQLKEVNTLVKGQIDLPSAVLMESAIPGSPYLAADNLIATGSGSGTLRVRNNLVRGSNGR